jgi:hypothetical protein
VIVNRHLAVIEYGATPVSGVESKGGETVIFLSELATIVRDCRNPPNAILISKPKSVFVPFGSVLATENTDEDTTFATVPSSMIEPEKHNENTHTCTQTNS